MRIVHIITGLNTGGAELMLKRLILKSRSEYSVEAVVISLTGLGVVGEDLREEGVEVIALGLSGFLNMPAIFFRLCKILKSLNPDIVQTWMYHADFLGGAAARVVGLRAIIWGVRTTDVTLGRSNVTVFLRKVCAFLSFYVPKVIICAADASRHMHESVGYDKSKMAVINNGFELQRFTIDKQKIDLIREECGFSLQDTVISSIGRFNPVKNQKGFLIATSQIIQDYPSIRLLMVGRGNSWDNIELVEWISELGLEGKVCLLGERRDVIECMAVSDIFCQHSITEGFPNVLGEAMAMALPCVATDVGDTSRLLSSCGKVVPSDVNSIKIGLIELLNLDAESLKKMGEVASRRIAEEYSLDNIAKQYYAIYSSLLN